MHPLYVADRFRPEVLTNNDGKETTKGVAPSTKKNIHKLYMMLHLATSFMMLHTLYAVWFIFNMHLWLKNGDLGRSRLKASFLAVTDQKNPKNQGVGGPQKPI